MIKNYTETFYIRIEFESNDPEQRLSDAKSLYLDYIAYFAIRTIKVIAYLYGKGIDTGLSKKRSTMTKYEEHKRLNINFRDFNIFVKMI